jgi:hypothetical protein
MSLIRYKVQANKGFLDGNIFPRRVHPGEIIVVDEQVYFKMKQSDPDSIELLDKLIPNPKKVKVAND